MIQHIFKTPIQPAFEEPYAIHLRRRGCSRYRFATVKRVAFIHREADASDFSNASAPWKKAERVVSTPFTIVFSRQRIPRLFNDASNFLMHQIFRCIGQVENRYIGSPMYVLNRYYTMHRFIAQSQHLHCDLQKLKMKR